jgi:hypothetical protein
LAVNNTHFTVFAVSKNQLDFFNTFEFTNVDDLLYYTLHVVNSLQYSAKEWTLSWHSDAPHNELLDSFSSQMQNNTSTKKVVINPVSKIKHQLLCV